MGTLRSRHIGRSDGAGGGGHPSGMVGEGLARGWCLSGDLAAEEPALLWGWRGGVGRGGTPGATGAKPVAERRRKLAHVLVAGR